MTLPPSRQRSGTDEMLKAVDGASYGVSFAAEDPRQDDVRELIRELNEALLKLTPQEYCHHMSVEEMAQPHTTVFVVRNSEGRALACGALRRHHDGFAEVKRMYTRPGQRGHGLGRKILEHVEALARAEGFKTLVLETGNNFVAAIRLYESQGFRECGPVLDYPPTPFTAFFQKSLQA